MRIAVLLIGAVLLLAQAADPAIAQLQPANPTITVRDTPVTPAAETPSQPAAQRVEATQTLEALQFRANFQLVLTLIVTLFGFVSLLVVVWLFRPTIQYDSDKVVRVVIVVMVVSASLILITGGYSNEQIAPAFGLFGTIVGYIFGLSARRPAPEAEPEPKAAETPATTARTAAAGHATARSGG